MKFYGGNFRATYEFDLSWVALPSTCFVKLITSVFLVASCRELMNNGEVVKLIVCFWWPVAGN